MNADAQTTQQKSRLGIYIPGVSLFFGLVGWLFGEPVTHHEPRLALFYRRRWILFDLGLVFAFMVALALLPMCNCGSPGRIAWNDTKSLEQMYEGWAQSNDVCPDSIQEMAEASWKGQSIQDPWGQEYQMACLGEHSKEPIKICSNGPDKQQGTEDDVCNWKPQPKS